MDTDAMWVQFGLRDNPFFQQPLTAGASTEHPLSLMVGREKDLELARRTLVNAGSSGRLVVEGLPGVGKTTFVNRLKAVLASDFQYITHPEPIRITAAMTMLEFQADCLRTLLQMRTAILGGSPEGFDRQAAEDGDAFWRGLVQQIQGTTLVGWGGQVGTMVASAGLTRQPVPVPRTIATHSLNRELAEAVARASKELRGRLLFHVNNFENLTLTDRANATILLAQIRDDLLIPGAHWLFVGPAGITQEVFRRHAQVAGIIPDPVILAPLSPGHVAELLTRRYDYLRLGPKTPIIPPISPVDASAIYRTYLGDLRNFLKLLYGASNRILGVAGVSTMTADEVRNALGPTYFRDITNSLTSVMFGHLQTVLRNGAKTGPCTVTRFRTTDVENILQVKTPSAKNAIEAWLDAQCIAPGLRDGRSQWYEVTGYTRIAFGIRDVSPTAVGGSGDPRESETPPHSDDAPATPRRRRRPASGG